MLFDLNKYILFTYSLKSFVCNPQTQPIFKTNISLQSNAFLRNCKVLKDLIPIRIIKVKYVLGAKKLPFPFLPQNFRLI